VPIRINSESHRGSIADCAGTKNDYLRIVCHDPTMACKIYSLGRRFLKPKDLENTRVNGLISLVAITTLA